MSLPIACLVQTPRSPGPGHLGSVTLPKRLRRRPCAASSPGRVHRPGPGHFMDLRSRTSSCKLWARKGTPESLWQRRLGQPPRPLESEPGTTRQSAYSPSPSAYSPSFLSFPSLPSLPLSLSPSLPPSPRGRMDEGGEGGPAEPPAALPQRQGPCQTLPGSSLAAPAGPDYFAAA